LRPLLLLMERLGLVEVPVEGRVEEWLLAL